MEATKQYRFPTELNVRVLKESFCPSPDECAVKNLFLKMSSCKFDYWPKTIWQPCSKIRNKMLFCKKLSPVLSPKLVFSSRSFLRFFPTWSILWFHDFMTCFISIKIQDLQCNTDFHLAKKSFKSVFWKVWKQFSPQNLFCFLESSTGVWPRNFNLILRQMGKAGENGGSRKDWKFWKALLFITQDKRNPPKPYLTSYIPLHLKLLCIDCSS